MRSFAGSSDGSAPPHRFARLIGVVARSADVQDVGVEARSTVPRGYDFRGTKRRRTGNIRNTTGCD